MTVIGRTECDVIRIGGIPMMRVHRCTLRLDENVRFVTAWFSDAGAAYLSALEVAAQEEWKIEWRDET